MMKGMSTTPRSAGLSGQAVRQAYAERNKSRELLRARRHEDWVRMHAEPDFERYPGVNVPLNSLLAMVQGFLPDDKYRTFEGLLRFPLPSVDVVDAVFNDLSDIFTGKDPVFSYQFHDPRDADDWEWYRKEVLGEPDFWSTTAWRVFRTGINSVMVVDMPSDPDPDDPKARPYVYFVPISAVVDYGKDPSGKMSWVMFEDSFGTLTVIDSERYRRYSLKDGGVDRLLVDNPHTLGVCPARFFWDEPVSNSDPDVKRSPITKVLSKLDWYVYSDVAKRQQDISGSYPIYWGYEQQCDYDDGQGHRCSHGTLVNADGTPWVSDAGIPVKCPVCQKHKVTGPGSFVEVPVPDEQEGQPRLGDPVGMLGVDSASLQYSVDELERQRKYIIDSCVGRDNTIVNETSLADKQIEATFENRSNVLENVKKGFESAQSWADSLCCRARYGSSFMSCSISYGTDFFTFTVEGLMERYEKAKAEGASAAELEAIRGQILETEFRNDPQQRQRMRILLEVEPYPSMKASEVLNLWEKGLTDDVTLELKNGFPSYVAKFERENDNVTEFAVGMTFRERVDTISKTLYRYAEETISERAGAPDAGNVQISGE